MYISIMYDRTDFLVSFFENPSEYLVMDFRLYDDSETHINICVPKGVFENCLYEYPALMYENGGPMNWYTQDGRCMCDIEEVTENLIFFNRKNASFQKPKKYGQHILRFMLLGLVCLFLLLLAFREFCRHFA